LQNKICKLVPSHYIKILYFSEKYKNIKIYSSMINRKKYFAKDFVRLLIILDTMEKKRKAPQTDLSGIINAIVI